MADPKIRYDIAATASGSEEVNRLAREFEKLDTSLDPAAAVHAAALRAEVEKLGQQQAAVANFNRLTTELEKSRTDLAAAETAFDKLNAQIAAAGVPTAAQAARVQKLADTLNAARERADSVARALKDSQDQLERVGLASGQAARGLDGVSQAEQGIKARTEALKGELTALGQELGRAAGNTDQVGRSLDAAFRTLGVKSVASVETEIQRLRAALTTIKMADPFGPDVQRATAAAEARIAALRGELTHVPPAADGAAKSIQHIGTSADSVHASLGNAVRTAVAWTAALAGINSAGDLARNVIATGSAFEDLHTRLEQLLGSTTKANTAFEQIKQLAITTPFEVKDLADSFIKLTAFGLEPSEKQMRALADTAAVAGGGTEALQRVTLALGQAWTKSKLQGDEILQLAEAGIPVWDLLAKATGKNTVELQKMSEAGALGRDVILKLFDALGEKNAGASARLMQTFSGTVSNAKDALAEFFDMIARSGVLDYLKEKLQAALAEFDRLKNTGELEARAKAIADGFLKMAQAVEIGIAAFSKLADALPLLLSAFAAKKVLDYAAALRTIGPAALAAAAETTTAAGAVGAVGTAAAAATPAVGLLTRAVGLLRGALAFSGATAVVALLGLLVSKFLEARRAAMEGDEAVRKMVGESKPTGGIDGATGAVKDYGQALKEVEKSVKDLPNLKDQLAVLNGEALAEFSRRTIENLRAAKVPAEDMAGALKLIGLRAAESLGVDVPAATKRTSDEFKDAKASLDTLIGQLPTLKKEGVDTALVVGQAVGGMINKAKTVQDVEAINAALVDLGKKQLLSADAVAAAQRQAADKAQELREKIEAATPGVQGLGEAARKAGVDVGTLTTGVSKGFADSVQVVRDLREQIVQWGVSAERASPILAAALDQRIAAAKTKEELALVRAELDKAVASGHLFGVDARDSFDKVKKKAEELSPALRQAQKDAEQLGITLRDSVSKGTAAGVDGSLQSYERLKAGGVASQRELQGAFATTASRAVEAAGGIIPEWVKVEAQTRNMVIEVDEFGKACVRAAQVGEAAGAVIAKSFKAAVASLGGEADQERNAELTKDLAKAEAEKHRINSTWTDNSGMFLLREKLQKGTLTADDRALVEGVSAAVTENSKVLAAQVRVSAGFVDAAAQRENQLWLSVARQARERLAALDQQGAKAPQQQQPESEPEGVARVAQDIRDKLAAQLQGADTAAVQGIRDMMSKRGDAASRDLINWYMDGGKSEVATILARPRSSQAATTPPAASSSHVVTINLPGGRSGTVNVASEADGAALSNLLSQLGSAARSAGVSLP